MKLINGVPLTKTCGLREVTHYISRISRHSQPKRVGSPECPPPPHLPIFYPSQLFSKLTYVLFHASPAFDVCGDGYVHRRLD
jgi:hypothetical protein